MGTVTTRHREIAINHLIAERWKPPITGNANPRGRFARNVRFVAGIAIATGGAGVLLSDLIHLMPALG